VTFAGLLQQNQPKGTLRVADPVANTFFLHLAMMQKIAAEQGKGSPHPYLAGFGSVPVQAVHEVDPLHPDQWKASPMNNGGAVYKVVTNAGEQYVVVEYA